MARVLERITCPNDPEHGMVNKRWLPPAEREMITKWDGDVFEIDCQYCGKYEYPEPENNPRSAH